LVSGRIKQATGPRQFLLSAEEKERSGWQPVCTGQDVLEMFKWPGAGSPGGTVRRQATGA
jgi:hypothetical protein